MKIDIGFYELINIIADYDSDIWNNPENWTKKEWHLWELYLYYVGLSPFKRWKAKRELKKAIRKLKNGRFLKTISR